MEQLPPDRTEEIKALAYKTEEILDIPDEDKAVQRLTEEAKVGHKLPLCTKVYLDYTAASIVRQIYSKGIDESRMRDYIYYMVLNYLLGTILYLPSSDWTEEVHNALREYKKAIRLSQDFIGIRPDPE